MNRFAEWVERKGIKQRFIADKLGISTSTLHGILRADHLPNLRTAYDIETFTRGEITVYDWLDQTNDANKVIVSAHRQTKTVK